MSTIYTFINIYLLRYLLVFLFASAATPSTAQYKIVVLGNSITQGNTQHPGYRYKLWQKLVDADVDIELVGSHDVNDGGDPAVKNTVYKGKTYSNRNEGHWGWTTDEILNGRDGKGNLQRWLQTYKPDFALIHLGTNDMFRQCSGGESADKDCYKETINELKTVVKKIRAKNPGVTILLAQLIPAYDQKVGPEIAKNIEELNKRIPALVQELNTAASPVILVDQYTGFNPTLGADTHDGVHPNASGEEKMAQKWYNALSLVIVPLPVELTAFTARHTTEGYVQLEWHTASETDNAYFAVQRSTDGNDFLTIGEVTGAGTTVVPQSYTYTDSTAAPAEAYYRLKQVDTDSTFSFSQVKLVIVPERAQALTVYPTSSSGHGVKVHLRHGNATEAHVYVYTSEGKLVHQQENVEGASGTFRTHIKTHQLHGAGLYLVRVVAGEEVYQTEFVVEQ